MKFIYTRINIYISKCFLICIVDMVHILDSLRKTDGANNHPTCVHDRGTSYDLRVNSYLFNCWTSLNVFSAIMHGENT